MLLEKDEVARNNALILFYYKENPNKLTDSQWAKRVAEMDYCLEYAGIRTVKNE